MHGLQNGTMSVRLSVPAWAHSSKPAAANLLLWARRAGDNYRSIAAAAACECGQHCVTHIVSVGPT